MFAVQVGSGDDARIIIEPEDIEILLGDDKPVDVHVLPWCCDPLVVDFSRRSQLQTVAEDLSKFVDEIEPCDPWVKATFGLEGVCEGAVYYPIPASRLTRTVFEHYVFKAKGEKHKVVHVKEAVRVDPVVAASVEGFVALFLTDARLEQGVTATGACDMKNTGNFLKWVVTDVQKESVAELAASNLTWEQVQKDVQMTARNWYKTRAMAI